MITAVPSQAHHWLAQQRVHPNADLSIVLPAELATLESTRVFLLTTRSLTASKLIQDVRAAIGHRLCGEFSAIDAHTPAEQVIHAAAQVSSCRADLLVAVGGGSVIDASKMVCFAVWSGLTTTQQLLAQLPSGFKGSHWEPPAPSPRAIAIPTTLSAAEFTTHAGITDVTLGRKHVVLHPWMIPKVVIMDPRATISTPSRLLLGSAVRAVDHAVERWCSLRPTPFSDAVSLQAMQMLAEALPAIHASSEDLPPRASAQYAAWLSIMGSWADVPVGASHGLGYILGAYKGVPHGETSCLMLPAVLQWNEPFDRGRQAKVAEIFHGHGSAATGLKRFVSSLGLPVRLAEVGIGPETFDDIAAQFDGSGPIATNPRPVSGPADLRSILELAA